jgi:hypothetical protein
MTCPNCNGEVWDNTEKVATGWRGPLKKCKAECGFIIWPPKTVAKKAAGVFVGGKREPQWTWPSLAETYHQSLLIARKQVLALSAATKIPAVMADILSAGATVFICATRDGIKKPTTAEELSEPPAALAHEEVDALPF